VEHPAGEAAEAVRLEGCDGVLAQAASAAVLKIPKTSARIMVAASNDGAASIGDIAPMDLWMLYRLKFRASQKAT
jgi:hypothetical protein